MNHLQAKAWGKRVKKALIDKNMTIAALAREIGVSREAASRVINAQSDSHDTRDKINEYLGLL